LTSAILGRDRPHLFRKARCFMISIVPQLRGNA
jgi:hypothetical protein